MDARPTSPGPDFLCVGLQKAGTQWLYDQLQLHPDFWMPPIKELHYFDAEFPGAALAETMADLKARPRALKARRRRGGWRPLDARDDAFFAAASRSARAEDRLAAYAELFAPKGRLLSGDVTPGYSTLDRELIARLAARFDRARAVLLLREPVARLWSRWRQLGANRDWDVAALQDVAKLAAFLDRPEQTARSFPSRIAEDWSSRFGGRFRFFFLDDVIARPAETRAEIIRFLGGDPEKPSGVPSDFNKKAKEAPAPRSEPVMRLMRERFEDERRRCAELFGGAALTWPDAPY